MSYYCFNRKKLLKIAWDRYHNKGRKQKATKYHAANQEVLREDASNEYKNLLEKERYHKNSDLNEKLKQYQRKYCASKE